MIGDNPNGEGQVVLRLLEGMIISAASFQEYDSPAHDGEIAPDEDIILDRDYYREHIAPQEDHLSREEIRETIENPDDVYEGTTLSGNSMWVWVKRIGDTVYYVRAEDFRGGANEHVDGIRIRSAYESDSSKLEELKEVYDLIKIWP